MSDHPRQRHCFDTHDHRARLVDILGADETFARLASAVAPLELPQWYIGAGAVRNRVWDVLHARASPTPPSDIDVVFFDPRDRSEEREIEIEARLSETCSDVSWDVKNQAAAHERYRGVFPDPYPVLDSAADGVAQWPETATCVGVRWLPERRETVVVAPYGLCDLFDLVLRRNHARVSRQAFERRIQAKQFLLRWPRLRLAADLDELAP